MLIVQENPKNELPKSIPKVLAVVTNTAGKIARSTKATTESLGI
jgi:hypothetical protein